jgi:hypothetical protein
MANKHMNKSSISLATKEMQINVILKFNIYPVRMAIIKKTINKKCWIVFKGKEILIHCWWEYKLVQSLWKSMWRYLKNTKNHRILLHIF